MRGENNSGDAFGTTESAPAPPTSPGLRAGPVTDLRDRLQKVLLGLPAYFEFNNHIAGVNATDLFSLNTLLGASIETQVVKALNQQRKLWDPEDAWLEYAFERQAQRFPDVRLIKSGSRDEDPVLGIELKGWFLLAKEGEPSFRFVTTPMACAAHDLLVVVPWYLDNVLSGSPVAGEPFVASARWAADYRNYYWRYTRKARGDADRSIKSPASAHPYPSKAEQVVDVPASDKGGNFGRIARVPGLMDAFIKSSNEIEILGIRARDWYLFLKAHSDLRDPDMVTVGLETAMEKAVRGRSLARAQDIAAAVRELVQVASE